jgi:hypothetical protein
VDRTKNWTVGVEIGEHDGHTRAVARLDGKDGGRLVGVALARLSPANADVPEIGDEIAAARALTDLGRRLLRTATEDVEQATGESAHLVM